jgi:hypothetical protein
LSPKRGSGLITESLFFYENFCFTRCVSDVRRFVFPERIKAQGVVRQETKTT